MILKCIWTSKASIKTRIYLQLIWFYSRGNHKNLKYETAANYFESVVLQFPLYAYKLLSRTCGLLNMMITLRKETNKWQDKKLFTVACIFSQDMFLSFQCHKGWPSLFIQCAYEKKNCAVPLFRTTHMHSWMQLILYISLNNKLKVDSTLIEDSARSFFQMRGFSIRNQYT